MKTLIIYDNTGKIFSIVNGGYEVPQGGINFVEVDSSSYEGKIIKSVNVVDKTLVLEEQPKTEIEELKEQLMATQNQVIDLLSR